jgi:hypothetical protein
MLSETLPDVPLAAGATLDFGVLQNSGAKASGDAVANLHRLAVAALASRSDALNDGHRSFSAAAGGTVGGGMVDVDGVEIRAAAATALVKSAAPSVPGRRKPAETTLGFPGCLPWLWARGRSGGGGEPRFLHA